MASSTATSNTPGAETSEETTSASVMVEMSMIVNPAMKSAT